MSSNDDRERFPPPAATEPEPADHPDHPDHPKPQVALDDEVGQFHARLAAHSSRSWVTPALVITNFAIFAIMVAFGVDAFKPTATEVLPWGADYGPRTFGGQPWRVISNAFLHFGLLHVALNMFALWQMGRLVERLFRPLGFAALYLGAAIGGSLASLLMHPVIVSAGASGAVFGVYGAFLAYLLRQHDTIPQAVMSRLLSSTLMFVGYNLFYGFTAENIDNSAHLGGLLAGFVGGWVLATPLGQPARPRRALFVVALAVALAAAVTTLRAPAPDYLAELDHFGEVETRALERYNAIVDQAKADKASDADVARVLEQEILPPWHAAYDRLNRIDGLPDREQALISRLLRYVKARFTGWTQFAAALRSGDPEAVKAAINELNRADLMLQQFNQSSE